MRLTRHLQQPHRVKIQGLRDVQALKEAGSEMFSLQDKHHSITTTDGYRQLEAIASTRTALWLIGRSDRSMRQRSSGIYNRSSLRYPDISDSRSRQLDDFLLAFINSSVLDSSRLATLFLSRMPGCLS